MNFGKVGKDEKKSFAAGQSEGAGRILIPQRAYNPSNLSDPANPANPPNPSNLPSSKIPSNPEPAFDKQALNEPLGRSHFAQPENLKQAYEVEEEDAWGEIDEAPKFTKVKEVEDVNINANFELSSGKSPIKIPSNPYKRFDNPPARTVLVDTSLSRNFRARGKTARARGGRFNGESYYSGYQENFEENKKEVFMGDEKIDEKSSQGNEKKAFWEFRKGEEAKGGEEAKWPREGKDGNNEALANGSHECTIEKSGNNWPNFGAVSGIVNEEFNIKTFKILKCPNGEKCRGCFKYHFEGEKRRDLDKQTYYPVMCPRGFCCNLGDKCGKCHNFFEIYYHPQVYKTTYCPNMIKFKTCALGNLCNGLHFVEENSASSTKPFLCKNCLKEDVNFMRVKCGHVCCRKCSEGDNCKKCSKPSECKKFIFD